MGIWKRPMTYTSTEDEWRAVRERVGVIDLSTLGKLDLKGKDAETLLDWVYTGRFANLKTGRTRYGILCGEDGTVVDDGTVSRLADDHFFITTTTGNVEFVEGWYKWWLAGSDLCVHLTNVTGDYAAINVAGPRAREVLQELTDLDLSGENFRYMMCRQGTVAGVPAILLRIGFVGETGWEIHYPVSYGVYLWRTILEAGSEFEIQPFGVETQRVLRLEKKHMIVGQDTDALSNPFEADLSWTVKLEKPDFVGKKTLSALASEDPRQLLVGFEGEANAALPEGSAIVQNGKPVGRVCSLKVSPHLGKCIGMAVVPASLAQPGALLDAYAEGKRVFTESGRRAILRSRRRKTAVVKSSKPNQCSAFYHVLEKHAAGWTEVNGWQCAEKFEETRSRKETDIRGNGNLRHQPLFQAGVCRERK